MLGEIKWSAYYFSKKFQFMYILYNEINRLCLNFLTNRLWLNI